MLPGLIRTDGYDYNAIMVVFDIYEIEQSLRKDLFISIKSILDVLSEEREERNKKK